MKKRKEITFMISNEIILMKCENVVLSRQILLEALKKVMNSNTHVLAQRPSKSDGSKNSLIEFINELP